MSCSMEIVHKIIQKIILYLKCQHSCLIYLFFYLFLPSFFLFYSKNFQGEEG